MATRRREEPARRIECQGARVVQGADRRHAEGARQGSARFAAGAAPQGIVPDAHGLDARASGGRAGRQDAPQAEPRGVGALRWKRQRGSQRAPFA